MSVYLYLLTLLFFVTVEATDLSTGSHGEFDTGSSNSEYIPDDGNCPTLLKKWVEDDFTDQSSFGFQFKSEAKTCRGPVKSYHDYLKNKQRSINFSDSLSLGSYLNQKYKNQVHKSYQTRFLKDCNSLPPDKSTVIQARFYAASARIAAVNSPILDEVSYYDSVLPGSPAVLHDIECTPMFPENNKKCSDYKIQARSCAKDKQKRFENLVIKTKKNLLLIEDLIQAHRSCINKITAVPGARVGRGYSTNAQAKIKSSCDPFLQIVEIKKNETPWIRGEIFKKLAIKKAPSPRSHNFSTEYDFSDKKIEQAIAEQISANRKALSDNYKNNIENFRCLSTSVKNNGKACDFKKIRSDLVNLPDLNQSAFSIRNAKDTEAKIYLDAESCLLERGEDRAKTQSIIDSSGTGILLTVATLGLGSVASGIRAVNAASKVGRNLSISNGLLGAALTTEDLKHTYQSCSQESKMVTDLSSASQVTLENICADPKLPLAQAREKESDCLVSALLSAPGVLPFVGAVPSLVRLTRKPASTDKAALDKFISNMSGRENLRAQDLNFAGSLNREDRILAAEGILSRNLSQKEKDALIAAHKIGGPTSYNGHYTTAEIAEKRDIMRAASFSERESETLLWKGITGFNKAEILPLAQKRASEFFGRPVSQNQAEAIVGDIELMTKSKDVRLKNLTDAGFTPQQAQEIMDLKLNKAGSLSATLVPSVPVSVAKPMAPQQAAPLDFNPFVQSSAYKGSSSPEALNRLAQGGHVSDTEARMGLSGYASANKISGASQAEVYYKSMEKLANQTFKDAEDVKKALANPRLSASERKNLTESYEKIKAKCQSLSGLAAQAGLNGNTMQSNLQSRIREVCN